MNILLTNDDGIRFAGHVILREILSDIGDVYSFAPMYEKSATSQAITIYSDVFVHKIGDREVQVEGFPTDCVNIGLHSDLFDVKFDLVVSGINKGVNMGQDVLYSGTVGAAFHAYIHGIPAIAISCGYLDAGGDFTTVARFVRDFITNHRDIALHHGILNINHPPVAHPAGIRYTRLGRRIYHDVYTRVVQPGGKLYMNLGGSILSHHNEPGTDFAAYDEGYISITPLTIDATDHARLADLT